MIVERGFPMLFKDRFDAGRLLASKLRSFANRPDTVVLALPRGGVPVGYEVAKALNVPLDVFVVRKLGVPGYEELAMGAIASGGIRVLNEDVVRAAGIPDEVVDLSWEIRNLRTHPRARKSGASEPILALGRKHMAHNHGSEYQVRIVHEDGTEELSGWLNSAEQFAQAIAASPRPQGKVYWLPERKHLCSNCLDR